jgi:hypothetical protein
MVIEMFPAGEMIIQGTLKNSVISPNIEKMMKIIDVILKGMPEYEHDPDSFEKPNDHISDPE